MTGKTPYPGASSRVERLATRSPPRCYLPSLTEWGHPSGQVSPFIVWQTGHGTSILTSGIWLFKSGPEIVTVVLHSEHITVFSILALQVWKTRPLKIGGRSFYLAVRLPSFNRKRALAA